jgi:hypothetical protein
MPARPYATLFIAGLLFAAGACVVLSLARWPAGDLAILAREVGRGEAMDQRLDVANRVTAGKHRVTAELVDGRITPARAAERFRELNALTEDGEDDTSSYQAASDEEAVWRNVYFFAVAELDYRRAPDAAEVLAWLQAGYRERFGHDAELDGLFRQTP